MLTHQAIALPLCEGPYRSPLNSLISEFASPDLFRRLCGGAVTKGCVFIVAIFEFMPKIVMLGQQASG